MYQDVFLPLIFFMTLSCVLYAPDPTPDVCSLHLKTTILVFLSLVMKISVSWHWISLSLLTFFLHLVNLVYYFALFILLTAVYIRFVFMPPPSPLTSVPMNESKKECLCCPLRLTGRVKSEKKKKKSLKVTDVQRQLERSTNIIKNLSKIEKEETKKKIERNLCSVHSVQGKSQGGQDFSFLIICTLEANMNVFFCLLYFSFYFFCVSNFVLS